MALVDRPRGAAGKGTLHDLVERPGGQVATALLTCARLGLRCAYAGAVGDDAAADAALAPLGAAGIDLAGVVHRRGSTRRALVLVEAAGGERQVLARRDPAVALGAADLDRGRIAGSRALLVDLEDPDATRWAISVAHEAGVPVVLDADRADADALAIARSVDFPIVSQGFAEQFSSDASPDEALAVLTGAGATLAVVTLGERGAAARWDGETRLQPAFPVDARDTTGAGDVFRGAFVWGLLNGLEPQALLETAARAGSLACRGLGAQGALPDLAELAPARPA